MSVRSPPAKPSTSIGISSPSSAGDKPITMITTSALLAASSAAGTKSWPGYGPEQLHLGIAAIVDEIQPHVVQPARFERHRRRAREDLMFVESQRQHFLPVQEQAIPAGAAHAQLVDARNRRDERTGPAHRKRVGGRTAQRRRIAPSEIDQGIQPRESRLAGEGRVREVGAGQAALPRGAYQSPQAGRRDRLQRGHAGRDLAAAGGVHRGRRRHGPADAFQRRDGPGRCAVVVAEQYRQIVSVRPDDRDGGKVLRQRQQPALVLQQHDRLLRSFSRQLTVRRRIVHLERDVGVLHPLGRVKHAPGASAP